MKRTRRFRVAELNEYEKIIVEALEVAYETARIQSRKMQFYELAVWLVEGRIFVLEVVPIDEDEKDEGPPPGVEGK